MGMKKWNSGLRLRFQPVGLTGRRVEPTPRRETLARYIIRASFSQERMNYHRETGQVQYRSKDGKETKVIDALEWLAAMCSHVPNKGEQMARYYG